MEHPAFYTPEGETPNWRLAESNIGFDARNDINGWANEVYDDSAWPLAVEAPREASEWGELVERPIPQWKDYGVKPYEQVCRCGDTIVCELPYNAQITPVLTVEAPAGADIGIRTDDYKPTGENSLRAEYVTRAGRQTYESPGWLNGHKVMYTVPPQAQVVELAYRESGYDCDFGGSFECDNEELNKLWQKAQRTLYITMRDNFMDCPDRERAQWIGDFAIELEEIFYALSPSANALSAKCFREFAGWQRENGELHAPIPAGNYEMELPQQCLAAMGWGAWTYYMGTADKRTISDAFPAWKAYIHIWEMDSAGRVKYRRGGWDWGDWGTNQDMQALCQLWFAVALDYYAKQAELVGELEEAAWARTLNASLIEALRANMKHGDEYRHESYAGPTDDRTQAMAVLAGVADASEYEAMRRLLLGSEYASPYMERFVLEALCQMGYVDDAIERILSRYKPMIDSEFTTLWELFTLDGGTYNHAWSGGPLVIMSKYIAGVQPLEPGYARFLVRPHLGSLNRAQATVPAVCGDIKVNVEKTADGLSMTLVVPDGAIAIVSFPSEYEHFTVNGVAENFAPSAHGDYAEGELPGGCYRIEAHSR